MSLHARRRAALPLALFLGLFAYAAGCGGDSGPVTAESSKFRPAGDSGAPAAERTTDAEDALTGADEAALPAAPRKVKVQAPRKGASASDPAGDEVPQSPFEEQAAKAANPGPGRDGKYPIPDGKDMQALLRFVDQMATRDPQGSTQEEVMADMVAIHEARLLAARRALSGKLDKRTQGAVLTVIQQIHSNFASNDVPGTKERIAEFAGELAASSDSELAELGRLQGFQLRISDILEKKPQDASEIVAEVKQLVADEKESIGAFIAASQVSSALQQLAQQTPGLRPGAAELLTFLGTTYKEHPQKQVAEQAAQLLDGSRLVTIDLGGKYEALKTGEADAEEKLKSAVEEVLAQPQPSAAVLQELRDLAYKLEAEAANYELAQFVYDALEKGFAEHENDRLKEAAASLAGSAKKRIDLIGKPLVVEGVLLNGQPFNWSDLAGKVVLVDFWATWCGPCLAEFPNIAENYEAYHQQGFEVVGVSVDKDMADLEQFFARQDVPWLVVVSQELYEKKSIESEELIVHPLAEASGIDAIPFVVLVGKDGNVDSIHVRGEKLHLRLKELLGEPAESDAPKGKTKGDDAGDAKPAPTEPEGTEESADASGCGAEPAEEKAAEAPAAEEESTVNPYLAKPSLSTADLVKYIEKMLDKPKTIQARPGFAEAVCDACDRVLKADPPADQAAALLAAETKLETLHKAACDGDAQADERLAAFCEQLAADARPKISQRVAFYALERKVLAADQVPPEQIDAVLKEIADYCGQQPLDARHLRLASSTVALINRLEDGEAREKHFVSFGNQFAKASDKELARYGKKLAKKPAATESDLVGKELELSGTLASGAPFDWKKYRGKVVLVDFWATWCGPCLREMPLVREMHERLHEQGLEVVGISLDKDPEALAAFLAENEVPWETLAGDETQGLAEKYGVRGIPTMMAVDKDGKILGVAHQVAALRPILEKALEK